MDADFVKLMHAKGEPVVDCDGHLIGKVAQLACDPTTYRAEWLVVKTLLPGRSRLVPVGSAIEEGATIRVPFSRSTVLDAPSPLVAVVPAMSECGALEEYYYRAG